MVEAAQVMTWLNIVLALGAVLGTVVSWLRGGVIKKTITVFDQVDRIEEQTEEINDWKEQVEDILIAISISDGSDDTSIEEEKVKKKLGRQEGYKSVIDDEWNSEDKMSDGGNRENND